MLLVELLVEYLKRIAGSEGNTSRVDCQLKIYKF
jgi:hypothetical protein